MATATKLTKAERRDQLLKTARSIVRERGADALTLGRLAESAGVSKPLAYEHFGTREDLLIALYRKIDAQQVEALQTALAKLPRRLDVIADAISSAFLTCVVSTGPEALAISAALKGDVRMETVQQDLIDGYVDLYREALEAFSPLSRSALRLRCIGILGAAESISRELLRGRADETTAAATLASLIVDVIHPGVRSGGCG